MAAGDELRAGRTVLALGIDPPAGGAPERVPDLRPACSRPSRLALLAAAAAAAAAAFLLP
jgi:hypothetical protein